MAWDCIELSQMNLFITTYYISNISSLLQKFYFPIETVLNSLQTQKGLELVLRPQFLQNFSFIMCHKLAKFHEQTVFISQVIQ